MEKWRQMFLGQNTTDQTQPSWADRPQSCWLTDWGGGGCSSGTFIPAHMNPSHALWQNKHYLWCLAPRQHSRRNSQQKKRINKSICLHQTRVTLLLRARHIYRNLLPNALLQDINPFNSHVGKYRCLRLITDAQGACGYKALLTHGSHCEIVHLVRLRYQNYLVRSGGKKSWFELK